MSPEPAPGTFGPGAVVLVVGPSGAGKDSVIRGARDRLPSGFVFPRRFITRPPDASEESETLTAEAFDWAKAAGAFILDWHAHGLSYGIGRTICSDVAAGRTVVVNVSRTVIPTARRLFVRPFVTLVTAPAAILAERLAGRGRDTDPDQRLRRTVGGDIASTADLVIDNSGPIEEAVAAFCAAVSVRAAPEAPTACDESYLPFPS